MSFRIKKSELGDNSDKAVECECLKLKIVKRAIKCVLQKGENDSHRTIKILTKNLHTNKNLIIIKIVLKRSCLKRQS
jgi:hypothetical protein